MSQEPASNSTFDRGSLSPTHLKPFDVFAKGSRTGDWLAALDDFRNWLICEAPSIAVPDPGLRGGSSLGSGSACYIT
jgi:hypothetical protein